jgi:hypothetical protein
MANDAGLAIHLLLRGALLMGRRRSLRLPVAMPASGAW